MPTDVADAHGRENELRQGLLAYLEANPAAADTAEGIQQWWLPASLRPVSLDRLQRVLKAMAQSGEVRCSVLPDGTRLYGRAT